jgi:hypothetical protein
MMENGFISCGTMYSNNQYANFQRDFPHSEF